MSRLLLLLVFDRRLSQWEGTASQGLRPPRLRLDVTLLRKQLIVKIRLVTTFCEILYY